jgi:actin-like ATPase involved in cell morphogenesis
MYTVGVDLGTTFAAAAVWRDGRAEISPLGMRTAEIPSVVLARPDGTFLTGEAATRRALLEPDRVAREFKRRLGDSTPLLLGGSPFSAVALTARLLSAVVTAVIDREGGRPRTIWVCHPANWGPFKTDLLCQAVHLADLGVPVGYTTEPEAAAVSYARQERLAVGDTVAVYDLGGGTFDAAVLRRTARGFEILGQPEGIERLGGIDIDAAVFSHVARAVGAALTGLDEDDPAAMTAVARLRAECTDAKEALSSDTDVTIPVLLPAVSTEVRLTRAELEEMVRPSLYDSIESLKRAVRTAGVEPSGLSAVLLVGGSSRMPLVAQLVGSELGRPIAVDAHPKHAIALGAAWLASGTAVPVEPGPAPATVTGPAPATVAVATTPRPEPASPPWPPSPPVRPGPSRPLASPPRSPAEQQPLQQEARPTPLVPRSVPVPADGVTMLRPANPPAGFQQPPPAGFQQPPPSPPQGYRPAASTLAGYQPGLQRPAAPPSGTLPFETSPQRFADAAHEAPLRFTPQRGRSRRPFIIGGAAGLAVFALVVAVWAALNPATARQYLPGSPGTPSVSHRPASPGSGSAPSAGGQTTGAGQANPAPGGGSAAQPGTLLVNVRVSGRGSVHSADGRINCPDSCQVTIPANTQLVLMASARGFLGWSQCSQRNYLTCTVGNGSGTTSPLARFSTGGTGGGPTAGTGDGQGTATPPTVTTGTKTPVTTPIVTTSPPAVTSAAPKTTASASSAAPGATPTRASAAPTATP